MVVQDGVDWIKIQYGGEVFNYIEHNPKSKLGNREIFLRILDFISLQRLIMSLRNSS